MSFPTHHDDHTSLVAVNRSQRSDVLGINPLELGVLNKKRDNEREHGRLSEREEGRGEGRRRERDGEGEREGGKIGRGCKADIASVNARVLRQFRSNHPRKSLFAWRKCKRLSRRKAPTTRAGGTRR